MQGVVFIILRSQSNTTNMNTNTTICEVITGSGEQNVLEILGSWLQM